ncbi:hypothetical protein [Saccharibacter floricola]|nr:hypothetical protein [Saccharibacter floricola]
MYGLFPYLIQNISVLNLTFIGITSNVVIIVAFLYGMLFSAWLAVLCVAIRSEGRNSHLLLPPKPWEQYVWGGLSLFACILIGGIAFHKGGELSYFFGYIFCAGFVCWLIMDSPNKHWEILLKRSAIAIMVAIAMLAVLPQAFSPFMNVIVSILEYRSKGSEAILVDDDAYQQLNALTAPYNQKPKACLVMIGSQKMWHLQDGTIILQGIGKQTYVSVGSALPPQPFLPSQVMALPLEGLREKC